MLLLTLTLLPCVLLVDAQVTHKPRRDVVEELNRRGGFSLFLDLLRTAGMLQNVLDASAMTLFAPTDAALSQVPSGTLTALKADTNELKKLLGYHIVLNQDVKLHGQGSQDQELTSSVNLPIRINYYNTIHTYSAEGVNITVRNIQVANGHVHGLESTINPPLGNIMDIMNTRSDLATVKGLVAAAGLYDAIRNDHNTTTFVPSNKAFEKVDPKIMSYLSASKDALSEVLLYHFVDRLTLYSIGMKHTLTFPSGDKHHDNLMILEDNSGGIFINHAKITERDISATNGVMHVIDDVLIPANVLVKIEDIGIVG